LPSGPADSRSRVYATHERDHGHDEGAFQTDQHFTCPHAILNTRRRDRQGQQVAHGIQGYVMLGILGFLDRTAPLLPPIGAVFTLRESMIATVALGFCPLPRVFSQFLQPVTLHPKLALASELEVKDDPGPAFLRDLYPFVARLVHVQNAIAHAVHPTRY